MFEGNLAGQGYPYPAKYDYKYDQYKESNKSGLKDKHKIVTMKPKKIEKASMINWAFAQLRKESSLLESSLQTKSMIK